LTQAATGATTGDWLVLLWVLGDWKYTEKYVTLATEPCLRVFSTIIQYNSYSLIGQTD
jgi:hypothetical protein